MAVTYSFYKYFWLCLGLTVTASVFLWERTVQYNYKPLYQSQEYFIAQAHFPECWNELPLCPMQPPNLHGQVPIVENITIEEAEANLMGIKDGGSWWPTHCKALWRVAVIVPYRNRYSQIGPFLNHMHNFLKKQELNYTIYIVEQGGVDPFNKASIMNVGYLEAQKQGPWDCFVFHDIDLLPEDNRHLYHCAAQPRHLTVAPSSHNYSLMYEAIFGGACIMTTDQIERVNGWSNRYWGWGAEDDDMWNRIHLSNMSVWRYHPDIARYRALNHKPSLRNEQRYVLLEANRGKHLEDGLNSLQYRITKTDVKSLYTYMKAYVKKDETMAYINQNVTSAYIKQNGTMTHIKPNGTMSYIKPNGTMAYIKPNGTMSYINLNDTMTHIQPNGTMPHIKQNGTMPYINQNGTMANIKANRTTAYIKPNGTMTYIKPNGTMAYIKPNGIMTHNKQNGTVTDIKQNGTSAYFKHNGISANDIKSNAKL